MSHRSLLRTPFRYTFSNAALALIGINIVVYLLCNIYRDLAGYLGLNILLLVRGKMYWQPITYMFVHGSFSHILFNMLGILFFGTSVERSLGSREFLLLYFICGILSGIFSLIVYWFTGMYGVFLIGASGAIYGILLAYAVIFPRSQIFIWGIIPVPAPILVAVYALIEIGGQLFGSSGVAHMTHLAGLGITWLYFMIRMGINPYRVWKDAYR